MIHRPLALAVVLLATSAWAADRAIISVDASKPGAVIDPRLYGVFLEEIGHGVDGGLYGELIQNRGFEDAKAPEGFHYQQGGGRRGSGFRGADANGGKWVDPGGYATTFIWNADKDLPYWSLVTDGGGHGAMSLDMTNPLNEANPRSCKLVISDVGPGGRVGIANAGFTFVPNASAIGIKEGEKYELSFWARGDGFSGSLAASLESGTGVSEGNVAKITGVTSQWKQYKATLTATKTDGTARFVLAADAPGTLWFDMVSLFPAKTFKDHPNGLRPDIAQMISDLKPGFVRFPGGCVVEAATVETTYNWKNTLGSLESRPECWNAWDYRRTHGMGIYEYLQFIEDIGAAPMWVGFAGQTCIYRQPEVVPMDQMAPIVESFADLAEYANGPVTSKYGKMRADSGHPQPFNLKLMEIGNENNGQAYAQRYPLVYNAIKAKDPQIQTIANERPRGGAVEMIDEHHYADPNWFFNNTHLYDNANRNTPLYLGETAVTSGQNVPLPRGNLQAALAEGSFLLGAERNSDVVKMISYAPLLGADDPRGRSELAGAPPVWHAMIYFDSLHSYGTVSYYLWKTLGLNRPSVNLQTTVATADAKQEIVGNVGVGTWGTSAEFKDLKVEKDGKVLYTSDFSKDAANWQTEGGRWAVQDGVYRQSANTNALSYIGDESWSDYTMTLKGRKLAGGEGFLIAFGHKGGDKFWWNLGGWGNMQHGIELNQGAVGQRVRGTIEANRWYDIKIEVAGTHIKAYLDGDLVHDVTARLPEPMHAIAGRDDATGDIIVKVINPGPVAINTTVNVAGAPTLGKEAAMTVVSSARLTDTNTLAEPTKVVPVTTTATGIGPSFTRDFPAYSLTVLRLKTRESRPQ